MVICFAFQRWEGGRNMDPKERSGEELIFYGLINTPNAV